MLVPVACPICGGAGRAPCARCAGALGRAGAVDAPSGLDECHALLSYEGTGRDLVTAVKYRRERAAVGWLAGELAERAPPGADLVTWAPTTAKRRRERGFDQAHLLARGVARAAQLPLRRALRRRRGPPQTGRTRAERLVGPTFSARAAVRGTVVLVDDVMTTGATLAAAARILRSAGAIRVVGLVAAATPGPTGAGCHGGRAGPPVDCAGQDAVRGGRR